MEKVLLTAFNFLARCESFLACLALPMLTNGFMINTMALFPGERAALGTVTDYGIMFIAPGGRVVHAPVFNTAYYFEMNK